jgi:hypothetical protein
MLLYNYDMRQLAARDGATGQFWLNQKVSTSTINIIYNHITVQLELRTLSKYCIYEM